MVDQRPSWFGSRRYLCCGLPNSGSAYMLVMNIVSNSLLPHYTESIKIGKNGLEIGRLYNLIWSAGLLLVAWMAWLSPEVVLWMAAMYIWYACLFIPYSFAFWFFIALFFYLFWVCIWATNPFDNISIWLGCSCLFIKHDFVAPLWFGW